MLVQHSSPHRLFFRLPGEPACPDIGNQGGLPDASFRHIGRLWPWARRGKGEKVKNLPASIHWVVLAINGKKFSSGYVYDKFDLVGKSKKNCT